MSRPLDVLVCFTVIIGTGSSFVIIIIIIIAVVVHQILFPDATLNSAEDLIVPLQSVHIKRALKSTLFISA